MAADLHYFFLLKDSPCVTNSSSPRWHSLLPLLGATMVNITRKLFEVLSNIFKMCNIIHAVKWSSSQLKLCWQGIAGPSAMNNMEVYCQLLRASNIITHYLPHNGVVHLICSARRQHGFAWDSRPVWRTSSAGSPVLGVVVSGGQGHPEAQQPRLGLQEKPGVQEQKPPEGTTNHKVMIGSPLRKLPETTAQGNMSIFLKQSPGCILLRKRI